MGLSDKSLQQGKDASFTVDGMSMTSSTNTVTSAMQGVTLNLLGADPNTTLTLTIGHDVQGIENEINAMISAYNGVMSYVNTQMSYNTQTQQTGGPLFGDGTLTSIKSQLESAVLAKVGSGTFQYLSQIGITQGGNAQLSFNATTFENALSTNFNDVVNLLSDSAVTSDSQFQYVYNNGQTRSGTYNINISQAAGTGQNVAGQIDGYDASGQGDILTLNNTASNANGLEVSYTGTFSTASATITVNRGIASLIDSLVKQFTSPVTGTITAQQNSLQTNITNLNEQVSRLQDSINQQIANMTTEFQNMDVAVAQMYTLQSYLTAQFANL